MESYENNFHCLSHKFSCSYLGLEDLCCEQVFVGLSDGCFLSCLESPGLALPSSYPEGSPSHL